MTNPEAPAVGPGSSQEEPGLPARPQGTAEADQLNALRRLEADLREELDQLRAE